jgi:hypothetical protein
MPLLPMLATLLLIMKPMITADECYRHRGAVIIGFIISNNVALLHTLQVKHSMNACSMNAWLKWPASAEQCTPETNSSSSCW